jgi:hypothetical protein
MRLMLWKSPRKLQRLRALSQLNKRQQHIQNPADKFITTTRRHTCSHHYPQQPPKPTTQLCGSSQQPSTTITGLKQHNKNFPRRFLTLICAIASTKQPDPKHAYHASK